MNHYTTINNHIFAKHLNITNNGCIYSPTMGKIIVMVHQMAQISWFPMNGKYGGSSNHLRLSSRFFSGDVMWISWGYDTYTHHKL